MKLNEEYSPIRPEDLKMTTVYALDISEWSGKKNWKERTGMDGRGWPELDEKWFAEDAFSMSSGGMKDKQIYLRARRYWAAG